MGLGECKCLAKLVGASLAVRDMNKIGCTSQQRRLTESSLNKSMGSCALPCALINMFIFGMCTCFESGTFHDHPTLGPPTGGNHASIHCCIESFSGCVDPKNTNSPFAEMFSATML